jgi:hypothetical protein
MVNKGWMPLRVENVPAAMLSQVPSQKQIAGTTDTSFRRRRNGDASVGYSR